MKGQDFIIEEMDAESLARYANSLLEEMIDDAEEFVNEQRNNKNSTQHQETT